MPHRLLKPQADRRAASGWRACVVLAIVPLVAGCPTEVPYPEGADSSEPPAAATDDTATDEAIGPTDPAGEVAESQRPSPPAMENPTQDTPAPTAPATAGDRYATPANGEPARMPWETDEPPGEATPEAEDLFAGASDPPEPAPEAAPPATSSSTNGDGFGDFLGEAYAGLLDDKAAPAANEPPAETAPATADERAASPGSRYDSEAPPQPPAAESSRYASQPEPPQPDDARATESESFNDRWSESIERAEADLMPEPAEAPDEAMGSGPAPDAEEAFFDTQEPAADPPGAEVLDADPIEEPLFEDESEPLFDPPVERTAEPAAPVDASPAAPSAPPTDRRAPMASSAIEPLPAVPVLTFNTRHLAWLLGAKYGLAELADLDGATDQEVDEWSSEVERLAEELRIEAPPTVRSATDPAERVGRMMRSAARLGEALASAHGGDHAALLEISLKTNALLVVAEKRPDLAGPVARAVRDAADRALLPRFLWDQPVRVLQSDPTPEQVLSAVTRLHERVESFLR